MKNRAALAIIAMGLAGVSVLGSTLMHADAMQPQAGSTGTTEPDGPASQPQPMHICRPNKGGPGPCIPADYWTSRGYRDEQRISSLDAVMVGAHYCVVDASSDELFSFDVTDIGVFRDVINGRKVIQHVIYTYGAGGRYFHGSELGLEPDVNGATFEYARIYAGACLK